MKLYALLAAVLSTALLAEIDPFSSTIPVVDMRDFEDPQTRQRFIDGVSKALHEVGFFAVVNPGIDIAALKEAYRASQTYFESPLEQKLQTYDPTLNGQRGYVASERAQGFTQKDHKEFFHIGRDNNLWPDWMNLKTPMEALFTSLDQHGERLQEALSLAMNEQSSFLLEKTRGAPSLMRALHYPANPLPGLYWAAPHTDIDLFTILPMATEEGLQVFHEGRWIPVCVPADALIVNGGDLLENLTNGYFRSAKHRVMAKANVERYSIVYFIHAANNADLSPLPYCIDLTGGIQQFPSATEMDMLAHRLVELGLAGPELIAFDAQSGYIERVEELVAKGHAAVAVQKSYDVWQQIQANKKKSN